MKMENFTLGSNKIFATTARMLLFFALLTSAYGMSAQSCPLACNNDVQISLDVNCEAEITQDMVLEGDQDPACTYVVEVLDLDDNVIPGSPVVTGLYIGQTLKARIKLGANSCWGYLHIEDKLPPTIVCGSDLTVGCNDPDPLFLLPVISDNCDANPDIIYVSDNVVDIACDDQQYPDYSAIRVITYQAVDASGNLSLQCSRTIYYERRDLNDIVYPADVELDCFESGGSPAGWDTNGNEYPDPPESSIPPAFGVPTIDGIPIYPNDGHCEINLTYNDIEIPICGNTFKVLRTWIALDWCTAEIDEHLQIIKIIDDRPPVLTCPPAQLEVPADPYTCTASYTLPTPEDANIILFECNDLTYTVEYLQGPNVKDCPEESPGIFTDDGVWPDGPLPMDEGYTLHNLNIGCTWIRYIFTDACGNTDTCRLELKVVDTTPPIPVCDQFTVVTLTNNGWAHIYAETFDDGSHDNCTDVSFEVRRMTPGCGSNINIWKEFEYFCCDDIGVEIMVVLLVTDENGNSNSCMVNVTVQDKLDPIITCPPDMTLTCPADLHPDYTGYATAVDNCDDPDIDWEDFGDLNQCGVGHITRVWTATDAGGRTDQCPQELWIYDDDPFEYDDIDFPDHVTLEGCMNVDTDPSNPLVGYPLYYDDECSLVAHTYNDQVFQFVDGACYKILRTWTVIDWCQFDEDVYPYEGYWQEVQVIKINNYDGPIFDNCSDVEFCVYDPDCEGQIDFIATATDECTPDDELVWHYQIDLFNTGTFGFQLKGNDASGIYPVGEHRIRWTVEDMCGNITDCIQIFTVNDCKNPTPYCLSGITTVLMPINGQIEIWASDFDLGSFDNCLGPLCFSFTKNCDDTKNMVFTCNDLGVQVVEIWVTDQHDNQDYCETLVSIQVNNGACGDISNGAMIAGGVNTAEGASVDRVVVSLQEIDGELTKYTTDDDGIFEFKDVNIGSDFELSAVKEDDHMNGVSTLDLLLIQKHILQLSKLDSPYRSIAADINGSGSVTAIDLIELRKLILGVFTELPHSESWRFVDDKQNFADANDPWPFDEIIDLEELLGTSANNDMVAVKVGDVNGSAQASNFAGDIAENRGGSKLILTADDQQFVAGQTVALTVSSEDFDRIEGFQYTLDFDNSLLEYKGFSNGVLELDDSNFGIHNGAITSSWTSVDAVTSNDVLYRIEFVAKANGRLSNAVNMSSSHTVSEIYNSDLNISELKLNFRDGDSTSKDEFNLAQNKPNPFVSQTTIEFTLPEAMKASVTVYDVTGKVLKVYNDSFDKGSNVLSLDLETLDASGVLYYRLDAGEFTATKRMIALRK